jgi:hypothetical protein
MSEERQSGEEDGEDGEGEEEELVATLGAGESMLEPLEGGEEDLGLWSEVRVCVGMYINFPCFFLKFTPA